MEDLVGSLVGCIVVFVISLFVFALIMRWVFKVEWFGNRSEEQIKLLKEIKELLQKEKIEKMDNLELD